MTGSVLDILIYVFDQYMMAEAPEVPEREALAADLERAGFGRHNVERALDWLADLAGERSRPDMASRALRVFPGRGRGKAAFALYEDDGARFVTPRATTQSCIARCRGHREPSM